MKILALDLATVTGWAVSPQAGGTWDFGFKRHHSEGLRYLRLESYLDEILAIHGLDLVAYEDVKSRHKSSAAARTYFGLLAVVTTWCANHDIEYEGFSVGTIKKHATGKGNAGKEEMVSAAKAKWPATHIEDDNHADALWLWDLADTIWNRGEKHED